GLSAQMSRAGAIWRAIPCLETALAQGQTDSSSLAALQSLLEDEARHPVRMIALRGERAITPKSTLNCGCAMALTWVSACGTSLADAPTKPAGKPSPGNDPPREGEPSGERRE